MFRIKLSFFTIFLGAIIAVVVIPSDLNAQDVPQQTEAPKKPKRKRIKRKKFKGDRARSNRKQLRQLRFKTRSRKGDKPYQGDITGRKFQSRKTRRQRYVHPQPDPYAGRRFFGREADKPAPEPPPTFRKPPQGEKPRLGDITGKRRIRTRSASSARAKTYPRRDPYAGREQRSAERAGRIRRAQVGRTRSVTRSAERKGTVSVGRPKTISGIRRIRRIRNPYAGREQRKGERATNKDIAGRKLRTRNVDSAPRIPSGGYRTPDTYYGRKRRGDGGRFSRRAMMQGQAPSISQSGEQRKRRYGEPQHRNYQSPRPRTRGPSFDPYAGRKRIGEGERFRDRGKPPIRSASRKTERKISVQSVLPNSISGTRRIRRQRNPYAGREQRPGERATNRDIAGRKLRTRGYRSPRPQWGEALRRPDPYYGRKDRGDKVSKARIPSQGGRSISGGIWNNRGFPIAVKPPGDATRRATQFRGRFRPFELQPGYADDKRMAKYQGRFRPFELHPGYADDREIANFRGRFRPFELQPGYADDRKVARFQGNIKGQRPLKGGGSISGRLWNNKETPISVKPPGDATQMATQFRGRFRPFELHPGYADDREIANFRGRFRPFELQPGYADDRKMARFQGNIKAGRPLKGGGSISGRFWNNKETPISVKPPGDATQMATQFRGRFRPFELQPGYADDRGMAKFQGRFRPFELHPGYADDKEIANFKGRFRPFELQPGYADDRKMARFQGNIKAGKPLKGGGSISGRMWNNKENPINVNPPSSETQRATQFRGRFTPFELSPGYYDDRRVARYQGNIKARKPLKGAGGSISGTMWNNDEKPLTVRIPSKDAAMGSQFRGNLKEQKPLKGAGGSISGTMWNNDGKPVVVQQPGKDAARGSWFQGNLNASQFKKPEQSEGTEYGRKRSFFFLSPGEKSLENTNVSKSEKSADINYGNVQSLFFLTPARAKNYQGYVSKNPEILDLFSFSSRKQMHPSHGFTKGNGESAKEEKQKTFKLKIWWAKIFGANGNQPRNLKERVKKPRYDKRESDLWYE